jgi:hypothetical protein
MVWRRRRRVFLGRFTPPDRVPPSPPERIAAEGVAIAEAVIKLGLRNRIVVDVLRDGRSFDTDPLVRRAADEFDEHAEREVEAADRLREEREWGDSGGAFFDRSGSIDEERRELLWREQSRRATAAAFRDSALNEQRLAELVEQARVEAWGDVSAVLLNRLDAASHHKDAAYEREKSTRVAELLALDLTELANARGVELS